MPDRDSTVATEGDAAKIKSEVERLSAGLKASQADAEMHSKRYAEYDRLATEHRQAHREAYERSRVLQRELIFAKRIADGYCAKQIYQGDSWRGTRAPCKNKAKPPSRFCGVHNRER